MIFTKFLFLLSVFILWTGCQVYLDQPKGIDLDEVGEDCGGLKDPVTEEQSKFCNYFVVFVKKLERPDGVRGYIPDCVYEQNIAEGKLDEAEPPRNYDFEMRNNVNESIIFRVTENYDKIEENTVILLTKQGIKKGERGLKMVKEIKDVVSGTTVISCVGG